jgi:hypothetical protein
MDIQYCTCIDFRQVPALDGREFRPGPPALRERLPLTPHRDERLGIAMGVAERSSFRVAHTKADVFDARRVRSLKDVDAALEEVTGLTRADECGDVRRSKERQRGRLKRCKIRGGWCARSRTSASLRLQVRIPATFRLDRTAGSYRNTPASR